MNVDARLSHGKTIRQIPAEEMVDLNRRLEELRGMLINKQG